MDHLGSRFLAFVFLVAFTTGSTSLAQRNIELSGPLERAPLGDVGGFVADPEGSSCLYSADPGRTGRFVLRRAPLTGAGPSLEFGPVDGPFAERGGRVFWLAPTEGGRELRTRRADGADAALVLSAVLAPGEAVAGFVVSADGGLVLYRAGLESERRYELFSVASEGGPVAKVSGPLGADGRVEDDVVLGPDGQSVYFRALVRAGVHELFRGTLDGRQPVTRLCDPHAAGRSVTSFALADEGTRIVYLADSRVNETFELFVAPTDGSAAPRLLGPAPVTGGDVREFALTSDGKRALFLVDALVRGRVELWSAEVASGAFRRLHPALPAAADVSAFELSEDGRTVVFRANPDGAANHELFVAPADASTAARRLGPDLAPADSVLARFLVRAGRAVYVRHEAASPARRVESIALTDGAMPVALSGALPADYEPSLVVGETRVVYTLPSGLESAPIEGGSAPVTLGFESLWQIVLVEPGELVLGLRVELFVTELLAQPADGSVAAYRVSAPFPPEFLESVDEVMLSPRGDLALYGTQYGAEDTYVVDVRGRRAAVLLHNGRLNPFTTAFTRDGARIVYLGFDGELVVLVARNSDGSGVPETLLSGVVAFVPAALADVGLALVEDALGVRQLLAVPFDGGPVVALDALLPSGFEVNSSALRVASDGRWAVVTNAAVDALYRLALDGSAPAEFLAADPLFFFRPAALDLELAPDGGHVAFLQGGTGNLLIAPLRTGAPVTTSSVSGVNSIEFDPSSRRLLVLAQGELYALEPDGTLLDVDQEVPDYVTWYVLDPSGARVLIVEGILGGGPGGYLFHLWSAPLDGSGPPVRLDPVAAGPAGRFVHGDPGHIPVAVTPDGASVVFATPDGLLRAAMDGSDVAELLVSMDDLGGDFPRLYFTPDAERLLYVRGGLFEVPLSGARPPVRIDTPSPFGGPGRFVLPLPDGRGVLFTARQEGNGTQLFLGFLERAVRPGPR
jgi:Tol biopolymer transport system component